MKNSLFLLVLGGLLLTACSTDTSTPVTTIEEEVSFNVEPATPDSTEIDIEEDVESDLETTVVSNDSELSQGEAHEDFQHITDSLTRYLIASYDEVAIVENCPAGYEYNPVFKDYFCADWESSWLEFEWLDGLIVEAPLEAGQFFLSDRNFQGGSSFQWSVDPTQTYWTYVWYESDGTPVLYHFNMRTGEQVELMSFYKTSYGGCEDGIRFIGWNNSGDRFALVSGNTDETTLYPDRTKIFVLTLEGSELLSKDKYNLPIGADCTANNGPFFMADWYDDDTIGYYSRAESSEDYENQMNTFWSSDRWTSEFVQFLDLD